MTVSDRDKAKMRSLAEGLKEAETDELPSIEETRAAVDQANVWRAAHGIPPLEFTDDDPPELELVRRARALGMPFRSR